MGVEFCLEEVVEEEEFCLEEGEEEEFSRKMAVKVKFHLEEGKFCLELMLLD